jgi:hypothetical protein
MRKHTVSDRDDAASSKPSCSSPTPSQDASRPGSESGSRTPSAALSAVQEAGPALVVVPAPPVTPPSDGMPFSAGPLTLSASASDLFTRPESPPVQEETSKHRRFSMLRFRNASDSQLATKAKQHAAAEKVPPIPRRRFTLSCASFSSFPLVRSDTS